MKFVTRAPISHPWLSHFFVSDLDRLGEISHAAESASGAELDRLAGEFSAILLHLRVGSFHKRTGAGRLVETERAIDLHLNAQGDFVELLDVGASDGATTCDLVEALERKGRHCRAVTMDLYQSLYVFETGGWREYRTADGLPVLMKRGLLALQLPPSRDSRDVLRNWLARRYMMRRQREAMRAAGKLGLISPRVFAKKNIRAVERSILAEEAGWRGAFDVVRASNVLNPRFFSREELGRAIAIAHKYLKPRGLLVISRNHLESAREVERGSVWRRCDSGFDLLEEFDGGSEIKADVAAFHAAPLPV